MKRMFILLLCVFFLCSCSFNDNNEIIPISDFKNESSDNHKSTSLPLQAVYHKISADEAYVMMEKNEEFILLDVRTDDEYKEQRISGSILIPDYEIENRAETELPDKDALILIYCQSGRRSANAANELVNMGYRNVYDFGGIVNWQYETEND